MKFSDIPQLTKSGSYRVNQSWKYLKSTIEHYQERFNGKTDRMAGLDMNPEFQRGHVWNMQQQIAYVEFKLKGGEGSDIIYFNCAGWMNDYRGPFVLVDGKQRLTAVLRFLDNELPIFGGHYLKDFEDVMHTTEPDFVFCVNDLPTMQMVYQWYLELNSGGTPHTEDELDKVRKLLMEEINGKRKSRKIIKNKITEKI